ncbi:hypothetical protein HYQ44_013589 [Verticillium longisporum]|nr:hypothetical protein HYQ44_013589 [Verticillium longisporum]
MMTNNVDRLSLAAFSLLASQVSITGASSMRRVTRSSIDSPSTAGLVARDSQHEPCWSVISLNPKEHGCKAAELAVNGTCQPLTFGDALESCPDDCEPGQWCDEGKCEPIQIILDPLHCGDITPVELAPGEVCVNGVAIPLDLTEDPYVCGPGEDKTKACDPGNYCDKGVCTPITLGSSTVIVGTDPYHCGVDAATCKPGQLCVDGGCHDIAVGQPLDKCKKEDLHPGTFCWESDIIPMHISTYPGSCPEGQVSVSGVCFGDLPKTCVLQGGSGSGSGSGSSSGSSSGSGSSSSGTVKGSAQYGGWFPDAGYGSVQHNGQWYNFGRPSSCGDKSCGPNSFCCGNTCLPLGGGSEFEGCGSGCSNGEFCYRDSCRPIYIGQPGGGPDGEYVFDCPCGDTVCGLDEVCIGGAVCVDLTPGNPGSCGSYGACPPSFICLKDTCVPGGGGGGDGEPGVCNPTCANDERCVDGACVLLSQPGRCDPACEGDDSCLNGSCTVSVGIPRAKRQIQGDCPEGFECDVIAGGVGTCQPVTQPANCGDTGGPCTGGLICVDIDVGGISADVCILPRFCAPVLNTGCDAGETCRLQVGGGGLTACVADTPPPGLTCSPACDSTETCTAPISGTGPNTCEPNTITPANCGDTGGPCTGGLICVDADVGGISADICILPRLCIPIGNTGCDVGETCRLQLGGGSLTACVPNTPPAGLTCTPACDSTETCTAPVSGTGPNTCEPNAAAANCGDTGGPCTGGLICVNADVGGISADICILPRFCVPVLNTGCETGETCRLQIGGGGLTACVVDTPPAGLTCTPACDSTETCTAPVGGTGPNTCEPNTAPANCGDTGGPCTGGLICIEADVGGASADICILPQLCPHGMRA